MSTDNKKILYVEILRIFAIIFVIFNHTNNFGFVHFTLYEPGSFQYWFYMFFSVITPFAVPVFFMLSGMLLLGKEELVVDVWKKRISKYVIVLIIFSLIYYIRSIFFYFGSFSISQFMKNVYSGSVIESYWFLYEYLAFLMILPFIRKIVRDMNGREFIYLLMIKLVFDCLLIVLQYRLSGGTIDFNGFLNPSPVLNRIVFYPIAGYYLGRKLEKVSGELILLSFASCILAVVITMLMTSYKIVLTGDISESGVQTFYEAAQPFIAIPVFLSARKIFDGKKFPKVFEKILINIGACVFGIYLIETAFREDHYYIYFSLSRNMSGFAAIWIYVLFIFVCCLILVSVFRLISGLTCKLIKKE